VLRRTARRVAAKKLEAVRRAAGVNRKRGVPGASLWVDWYGEVAGRL